MGFPAGHPRVWGREEKWTSSSRAPCLRLSARSLLPDAPLQLREEGCLSQHTPKPREAVHPTDPSPRTKGRYLVRSRGAGPGKPRKQTARDTITLWPRTKPLCVSIGEDPHQQGCVGRGGCSSQADFSQMGEIWLKFHHWLMLATAEVLDTTGTSPANLAMLEAGWILEICHVFWPYLVLSLGWGSQLRHSPCSRHRTSSRAGAAAPGAG